MITPTRDIALYHHVYSSLGGYKTLYVSRELDGPFREEVEELVRQVYTTLQRTTLYLAFVRGDYHWWIKAFFHGSDHVGRPRKCVHTILVSRRELENIPFFSPLDLDGDQLFIDVQAPLENVFGHLSPRWDLPIHSLEGRYTYLQERNWTLEDFTILYNALMSHQHQRLVVGPIEWGKTLAQLSGFLPWHPRVHLSICGGEILPSPPVPIDLFLVNGPSHERSPLYSRLVAVDLEQRSVSPNFPSPNRMVQYLTHTLAHHPERAFKLLTFLEMHPSPFTSTNDMYASLVSAFEKTHPYISSRGELEVEKNPIVWLENMIKYSQAGYDNIALKIADLSIQILREKYSLPSVEELEKRVEYLQSNFREYETRKDSILPVLTNLLVEYFSKVNPPTM